MSDSIYGPAAAASTATAATAASDKSRPSKKRQRPNANDSITKNNTVKTTTTTRRTSSLNNNTVVVRYNKRLLLETQRVPWIDFLELQTVGRSLLTILENNNNNNINHSSSSSKDMERSSSSAAASASDIIMSIPDALERVEIWKSRCCDGLDLPHAIESTAALTQILWKESSISSYNSNSNYTFQTMELRLSYASVVIRTINGLVDAHQQDPRVMASSVAHVCEHFLNIPSWLVDVRHLSTHNQLPTLSVLRMAARYMLQYLATAYWQPILEQVKRNEQNVILEHLQAYEEITSTPTDATCTIPSENAAGRAATTSKTMKDAAVKHNGYLNGNDESDHQQQHDHHNDKNEVDKDDDDDPLLLRSSRLGTNINMFAVLMGESKKEKKKRKLREEQLKAEEAERLRKEEEAKRLIKQKSRVEQQEPPWWKSSATACAEQLIKDSTSSCFNMIPIDVIWTVMLTHFIWCPQTTTRSTSSTAANDMSCTCCNDIRHHPNNASSSSGCRGVLVPTCLQSFPPTSKSVDVLRNRYRPLLTALGQQWPGLLSALLIHIVDAMIILETTTTCSPSTNGSFSLLSTDMNGPTATPPTTFQTIARKQQGLYFLDSWARFLLSSSFLGNSLGLQNHDQKQVHQPNTTISANNRKKIDNDDDKPACREILYSVMQYPLNSLCDRLLPSSSLFEKDVDDAYRATTTSASTSTSTATTATSTCRRLGLYLQDILGNDRHVNFGVAIAERVDDGGIYRSLSTVNNANMDKQTNCEVSIAMNDNNSNESVPVVYGPRLPNDESSCSEDDSCAKDELDNELNTMDQVETRECVDDAARTYESVVAMDIARELNLLKKSSGLSMKTDTQTDQTTNNNHDDKNEKGDEPGLTSCYEPSDAAGSSLSLAQMEALLFKQNDHKDNNDIVQETAAHYEAHVLQNVVDTIPMTNPTGAVLVTQQQQRSPWVKCLAWDACAIGSLPGYHNLGFYKA